MRRKLTVPGVSGDGIVPMGRSVVVQKRLPRQFRINRPWLMRSRGSTTARPEIFKAPRYRGSARTVHFIRFSLSLSLFLTAGYLVFSSRILLPVDSLSAT